MATHDGGARQLVGDRLEGGERRACGTCGFAEVRHAGPSE
jgi:hypothetical protein